MGAFNCIHPSSSNHMDQVDPTLNMYLHSFHITLHFHNCGRKGMLIGHWEFLTPVKPYDPYVSYLFGARLGSSSYTMDHATKHPKRNMCIEHPWDPFQTKRNRTIMALNNHTYVCVYTYYIHMYCLYLLFQHMIYRKYKSKQKKQAPRSPKNLPRRCRA